MEEPFTIVYTVSDSAGNKALAIARQIHVACPVGEDICPPVEGGDPGAKLVCSFDPNLCKFKQLGRVVEDETVPGSPPTIELVGPIEATITAGEAYLRCARNTPLSVVCERGALAQDKVDGDLTRVVEVRCFC